MPRTECNVRDADGTIVFGDIESGGSKQTCLACKHYSKEILHVLISRRNLTLDDGLQRHDLLRGALKDWLAANRIETLNVAGNRESKCPGIREFVSQFLYDALS